MFFVFVFMFFVLIANGVRGYRPIFNWRHQGAPAPSFCNMSLALAGFYNRVISQSEVAALYAAGKDRQCLTQAPSQPPTLAPTNNPVLPPTLAPHSPHKRCQILPKPILLWEFDDTHGLCAFACFCMCDMFLLENTNTNTNTIQTQKINKKHNILLFLESITASYDMRLKLYGNASITGGHIRLRGNGAYGILWDYSFFSFFFL